MYREENKTKLTIFDALTWWHPWRRSMIENEEQGKTCGESCLIWFDLIYLLSGQICMQLRIIIHAIFSR